MMVGCVALRTSRLWTNHLMWSPPTRQYSRRVIYIAFVVLDALGQCRCNHAPEDRSGMLHGRLERGIRQNLYVRARRSDFLGRFF